jgi:hypothetical protein
LEDVGLEAFVKRYSFYEFISGDTESVDFIEQRAKLWHTTNDSKKDDMTYNKF